MAKLAKCQSNFTKDERVFVVKEYQAQNQNARWVIRRFREHFPNTNPPRLTNKAELEDSIRFAFTQVTPLMCQRACGSVATRLQRCLEIGGGQIY